MARTDLRPPASPEAATSTARIVLASASPRRHALLGELGLRASIEVRPADVDETPRRGEDPIAMALRLAEAKARAAAASLDASWDGALIIAADTVVIDDGESLGKPIDGAENRRFLARLAGREHTVATGHVLMRGDAVVRAAPTTRVRFRALTEAEIDRYVATGEGLDKAGGYAVQARGAALVAALDGCWTNVVGLSLPTVVEAARSLGVDLV